MTASKESTTTKRQTLQNKIVIALKERDDLYVQLETLDPAALRTKCEKADDTVDDLISQLKDTYPDPWDC